MISKSNRSFSLLEVLITVAILSTATTFVFRSFTASLYSSRFSQNITLACYLAEDKIWEIEQKQKQSTEPLVEPEQEEKGFTWQYKATKLENPDLIELELTISWREKIRAEEYSMQFLTYLLPKKSD